MILQNKEEKEKEQEQDNYKFRSNIEVHQFSDLADDVEIYEDRHPVSNQMDELNPDDLGEPTDEELKTLRRIVGSVPTVSYLICLVELAERGSYYSVSEILTNFIQRPLPPGSSTGAPLSRTLNESAGALNMGLQVASALNLLLSFLAYVIPLYGGYVGDSQLGQFKAIWIGIIAGFISHVLFTIAGIPNVLGSSKAIAPTILGIITLAIGTGFIKPNLLPLLLDQYPHKTDLVKMLPSGEKVIIDREQSLQRMTLIFYWAINVGAFFQLGASYAERRVGFWLAFFFPTIMYLILPIVMFILSKRLHKKKPEGSVLTNSWRILVVTIGGILTGKVKKNRIWEYAVPSEMINRGRLFYNEKKKIPITWNSQWVSDVKQTLDACKIFLYFPIFTINDGGIASIETSQAGSMTTRGVPNDLFDNFNPLTIIVLLPTLNYIVYPLLRRYKLLFPPVYRISFGFMLAASSQLAGAIFQYQVYKKSPCGYYATTCDEVSPVSAWKEVALYILGASGGAFAMTTAYEISYTRSPPQMKGLVMAMLLFTSAISAAISQAVTPALKDPYLIWPFAACAIAGFLSAILFILQFRNLETTPNRFNKA
ncbi:uncharacterized protein PRCAT00005035001 [Priceomyces carsonii]|uniref:uncharacterized protein n=1 Tax=Priceomyces carsonii TaxID=28549 RepID=UPI002EDAC704|nr:unnamed protein product [Priceomyces carsonii]